MLNTEQGQAVRVLKGPCIVLAGAGTGKTRVITHRIAYMVKNGVDPESIVGLTFTNKAAFEMRERLAELLSAERASKVFLGTFHAFCVRLLKKYASYAGRTRAFTVQDVSGQTSIVRQIAKEMLIDKMIAPNNLLYAINEAKTHMVTEEEYSNIYSDRPHHAVEATVYKKYNQMLKVYNSFDFDDLIWQMVTILQTNEDIRKRLQNQFEYFLVDEFQDTNKVQMLLLEELIGTKQNLFVVGDDDQSIYSWRGANPSTMTEFETNYKSCKLIKLEQNYRSTNVILHAANQVIANNSNRILKELWSSTKAQDKIRVFIGEDSVDEANQVIEDLLTQKTRLNLKWKDFGILYRTNNQSRDFEIKCRILDIPYKVVGGQQFFDRKEVKDALAYIRVIADPKDDVSLLRIINYPARGVGLTSVAKLVDSAREKKTSLYKYLAGTSDLPVNKSQVESIGKLVAGMKKVQTSLHSLIKSNPGGGEYLANQIVGELRQYFKSIDFENTIMKEAKNPQVAQKKREGFDDLFNSIYFYFKNHSQIGLADFINYLCLSERDMDSQKEKADQSDMVTMLTLHSAKGLEYPHVYFVGLEENIIPHERSIPDEKQLQEERRLCYVGITRARERLTLCRANTRMCGRESLAMEPSRFLAEIPAECFEDESTIMLNKKQRAEETANNFFKKFLG